MRLRRSTIGVGGFRRVGRGRGFSYTDGRRAIDDPQVLARIKELAIPPAWRNVWICPYPNGHIQAALVERLVGVRGAVHRRLHPDGAGSV